MVLTLEPAGFIRRQPSTPRSIELLAGLRRRDGQNDGIVGREGSPSRPTVPTLGAARRAPDVPVRRANGRVFGE